MKRKREKNRIWTTKEREKTEAALLRLHMDLYENWQVDVSRWRLEHHYHELTETRAKRFAKEFAR